MAKSRLKIHKVGDMGRPMGAMAVIWGRVGGRGGGQQRLLESDRNWQESAESVSNALLPARGAADLKATASAADPSLIRCWLFCVICNCLCSWRKRAACVFNILIR